MQAIGAIWNFLWGPSWVSDEEAIRAAGRPVSLQGVTLRNWVQQKGDLDVRNSEGETALMRASSFASCLPERSAEHWAVPTMQLLLNHGANPDVVDRKGRTCLRRSISSSDRTICLRTLIKGGAKLDLQDRQGDTALKVAVMLGALESTRLLLQSGADPFFQGRGQFDAVAYLVYKLRDPEKMSKHSEWCELLEEMIQKDTNPHSSKEDLLNSSCFAPLLKNELLCPALDAALSRGFSKKNKES